MGRTVVGYKSFEDLEVYKAAREFRKKIYKLINKMLNGYIAYLQKRKSETPG
jgi:hypothetical protein